MNFIYLLTLILISIVLPIALSFIIKRNLPNANGWKETFKVDPNRWLLSQPLFWCSLAIPFLLFISFGSVVWLEYEPQLNADGYKTFLEISKLPLWLFAIAAPTSVIVARAHATEQTAKQINELEKKNNYELFIMHRNEFNKILSNRFSNLSKRLNIKTTSSVSIETNLNLYKRTYFSSETNGFQGYNEKYLTSLAIRLKSISDLLVQLTKYKDESLLLSALDLHEEMNSICNELYSESIENLSSEGLYPVKFKYQETIFDSVMLHLKFNELRLVLLFLKDSILSLYSHIEFKQSISVQNNLKEAEANFIKIADNCIKRDVDECLFETMLRFHPNQNQ